MRHPSRWLRSLAAEIVDEENVPWRNKFIEAADDYDKLSQKLEDAKHDSTYLCVDAMTQECYRLKSRRDEHERRANELEAALVKIRDRFLLALGRGELATGELVAELAGYAQGALVCSARDAGGEQP